MVEKQARVLVDDVPDYLAESRGDHNSPIFNPEAVRAIVNSYTIDKMEAKDGN